MDQWLVRTASNYIGGPFSRDEIVQQIQSGELGLQDEVCQANQYWIFLHEHQEVQRQLGVHMPRPARRPGSDEDITETQIETTDPIEASTGKSAATEIEEDGLPAMPDVPADHDGSTSVMARRSLRETAARARERRAIPVTTRVVPGGTAQVAPAPVAPHVPRVALLSPQKIERPSFWRGFAWFLVVAAILLVGAVLRLLSIDGTP